MQLRDFIPFAQAPSISGKRAKVLDNDDKTTLGKVMRASALALGFQNSPSYLGDRTKFEPAPFDLEKIQQAVDTDSYAKQAFAKHRELFWKEGWEVISESDDAADYLWNRIDFFEMAMKQPFNTFLKDVADSLTKYHNAFIVKSRDTKGQLPSLFPGTITPQDDRGPLVGFYLLPTETIEIQRDKHNRPKRYRQNIENQETYSDSRRRPPTWAAKDVIHLALDKKPGRAFGTPFMTSTIDDLLSLRQVEEDLLNLVHRELFPLFKFQVGSDEFPADQDEIDEAADNVESLRTEGALVMSHRQNVEVLGVEGQILDASDYLAHFKERVAVGLGVYPHHLGMTSGGGNRAMTDRLDVMLYDKVKDVQRDFADMIRLYLFDEVLREGGYDPTVNPNTEGVSDRCMMKFNEIDVDTQVKKETHVIQKVASGIETVPEGRLELGLSQDMDEAETVTAQNVRLQPTVTTLPGTKKADGGTTDPKLVDTTPDAANKPSTGGAPNAKSTGKGASNVIRPTNQYGTRTSPNIRRSADEVWLTEVVDLLDDEEYDIIEGSDS